MIKSPLKNKGRSRRVISTSIYRRSRALVNTLSYLAIMRGGFNLTDVVAGRNEAITQWHIPRNRSAGIAEWSSRPSYFIFFLLVGRTNPVSESSQSPRLPPPPFCRARNGVKLQTRAFVGIDSKLLCSNGLLFNQPSPLRELPQSNRPKSDAKWKPSISEKDRTNICVLPILLVFPRHKAVPIRVYSTGRKFEITDRNICQE